MIERKVEQKRKMQEIFLSVENYSLVAVPPLSWNGFKAIGNEKSIDRNCSDIPHDAKEIMRKKFDDPNIPYDWGIKDK